MKVRILTLFLILILGCMVQSASAAPIDLFQWIFYVDGTLYDSMGVLGSSTLPGSFSQTPAATGAQGNLVVTLSGTGNHNFVAFYDYELNESVNGFSNEFASLANLGSKLPLQSWEIDEPGFVFGNIYDHVQLGASSLDNTDSVPVGSPDDVSVALAWRFDLVASDVATIALNVGTSAPSSGFYISHADVGSETALYYSNSLTISNAIVPSPPSSAPEMNSGVLLLCGILGLLGLGWKTTNI